MKAAFREHVDKLTLAQLSTEACQKHMHAFNVQLDSTALGQTAIGSVDDVVEKIASILRCNPHQDAQSMKRLTKIHQKRLNAAMIEELLELARRCSEKGDSSCGLDIFRMNTYMPFMIRDQDAGILDVKRQMEALGYNVTFSKHKKYPTLEYHSIRISWE